MLALVSSVDAAFSCTTLAKLLAESVTIFFKLFKIGEYGNDSTANG